MTSREEFDPLAKTVVWNDPVTGEQRQAFARPVAVLKPGADPRLPRPGDVQIIYDLDPPKHKPRE